MTRNHVHFASGLPAGFQALEDKVDGEVSDEQRQKEPVISGMRNSSSILIFIDLKKALGGGLKFWKSANGVILSDGNDQGIIPAEFFFEGRGEKKGAGGYYEGRRGSTRIAGGANEGWRKRGKRGEGTTEGRLSRRLRYWQSLTMSFRKVVSPFGEAEGCKVAEICSRCR